MFSMGLPRQMFGGLSCCSVVRSQRQVNNGQGWGIPVLDDFVLSKSTLQMICVRVVLAGTVIKALLDAEIGLEEDCHVEWMSRFWKTCDYVSNSNASYFLW